MGQEWESFPENPDELPVLLVFSGSDWCANCIRFNNEVLTNDAFLDYSGERLLVYKADFPQRKKLTKETEALNEQLAEKFNPEGQFPRILLLDPGMRLMSPIPYSRQSSDEFTRQLRTLLNDNTQVEFKRRISAMGSFFEFIIVAPEHDEKRAEALLVECETEVRRIEYLISEWIPNSEVSMINTHAGIRPVEVSDELYQLIERSVKMGELTQGAFDITFQGLHKLWRFDGSQNQPPDSAEIASILSKIDYRKIELIPPNTVYLDGKGMAIGFGGIGQGYAVDRVRALLDEKGVQNYVVNSSGDVFAKGLKADGSAWKIGIADPENKDIIIRWLKADGKAVVTSGNYEKYFEYNGKRYAHIIDPKTGWPTQGILSTTVISPVTEVADALATALFVLGADVGIHLIDQLPGTDCIIIDDKKRVYYSRDLMINKETDLEKSF